MDEDTLISATLAPSPAMSDRTGVGASDEPLYQVWFSLEVNVAPNQPEKTIDLTCNVLVRSWTLQTIRCSFELDALIHFQ